MATAVATHLYALTLPLGVDDLHLVARCGVWLGFEAPPLGDSAPENFYANSTVLRDYFRPFVWFLVWLVKMAQSEPVGSVAFHAVWIAIHGATTWLLYQCLRDRFGALPAGLAALVFGTLPGTSQAVSWIAAGGDMLIVTFTLLGIRALQRAGSPATLYADVAAGACALIASLSKESAPVLFPAIIIAAATIGGRRTLTWVRLIAFLTAAAAISQLARAIHFGGAAGDVARIAPQSAGEFARGTCNALVGVATSRLTDTPLETPIYVSALTPILGEWAPAVLRWLPFLAVLLPSIVGFAVARGRRRSSFVVLFSVFLGSLIPAVIILARDGVAEISGRIYYSAAAALAALIACAFASLFEAKIRPILAITLLAPHGALQADLWSRTIAGEMRRGTAVDSRVDSLRAASDSADPNILFVAIDPIIVDRDRPMLGYDVEFVLSPPFHRPLRRIIWASEIELIDTLTCFRGDPRPIQVFAVEGDRFVALTRPLDGQLSTLPELEADPNHPLQFKFSFPVPGRAVGAVSFEALEPMPGSVPKCVWLSSNKERATSIGEIASAPNDSGWLLESTIVGVRFEGISSIRTPRLLSRLPAIEIVEPREGADVSPSQATLVLQRPPRAASYRVSIRPIGPVTLDVIRAAIELPPPSTAGSQVSIPLRSLGPVTSIQMGAPIPATELWRALEVRAGNTLRREQRGIELRVEALAPDGATVEAASPWTRIFVKPMSRS